MRFWIGEQGSEGSYVIEGYAHGWVAKRYDGMQARTKGKPDALSESWDVVGYSSTLQHSISLLAKYRVRTAPVVGVATALDYIDIVAKEIAKAFEVPLPDVA